MSVEDRMFWAKPGESMQLHVLAEARGSAGQWESIHAWRMDDSRWKPKEPLYKPDFFNERLALASVLLDRTEFGYLRPPGYTTIPSAEDDELSYETERYFSQFKHTFGLVTTYVKHILDYDWNKDPAGLTFEVAESNVEYVRRHGVKPSGRIDQKGRADSYVDVQVPDPETLWGSQWLNLTLPKLKNSFQMNRIVSFLTVQ